MSAHSLTPIFDDLSEKIKSRLIEASLVRKDWKRCTYCKVHEGDTKLMACTQCKPFLFSPIYYCSRKCQRADWLRHKAQCVEIARRAMPVLNENLESDQTSLQKRIEHWILVHALNIRQLIKQLFYFRSTFDPRSTKVLFELHIHNATLDPPLVWPSKIGLLPKVDQPRTQWPQQPEDVASYAFLFPGGSTSMVFAFEEDFGEGWRSDMEAKGEVFPAYDIMFLNLFLAAPQTNEVAQLQNQILQKAVQVGQEILIKAGEEMLPSPFVVFDSLRVVDNSSRALDLVQSDEWLQFFKRTRLWDFIEAA